MDRIEDARRLFPATETYAYFDTAAVGLASRTQIAAVHDYVDDWAEHGLDWVRGEAAAENARTSFAALIGADRSDVALIPSVSAAAGFVAAQFGPARARQSVVIGAREYSSNHYPWRMLAAKGYDVRQVPFRNGGLEPDDVARAGRRRHGAAGVQWRAELDRPPFRSCRVRRDRARGGRAALRRRLTTGRRGGGRRRSRAHRRAGDLRSQVPHERGTRARLLLPLPCRTGSRDPDQRGLESRARSGRELLRADDGSLAHRIALRQLDQLGCRDRERSRALDVRQRRVRTRSTRGTAS